MAMPHERKGDPLEVVGVEIGSSDPSDLDRLRCVSVTML